MKTYLCEFVENDKEVSLTAPLAQLQRRVGSRPVVLDGVPGHFELAEDEHATPQFIIDRGAVRSSTQGGAW